MAVAYRLRRRHAAVTYAHNMRRKFLFFLGAGTLALIVLTPVVWMSGRSSDIMLWSFTRTGGNVRQIQSDGEFVAGDRHYYLSFKQRCLVIGMGRSWTARGWEALKRTTSYVWGPHLSGFEFSRNRLDDIPLAWSVSVPCWLPSLLVAGLWSPWLVHRLRDMRKQNRIEHCRCTECGYDLRASKERCPECGTSAPAQNS